MSAWANIRLQSLRGRGSNRQRLLLVAALLAVAATVVALATGHRPAALLFGPQAPPPPGDEAACRQQPMAHVHHPSRLVVVAKCSVASGRVTQLNWDAGDGDLKLVVDPDPRFRRFLRPNNHGRLAVVVIPPDAPRIHLPAPGQRATFYGAWVLDRNRGGLAAIHPAWRIDILDAAGRAVSGRAPAGAPLLVRMQLPQTVPVGETMNITVHVQSVDRGVRRPEPQVHLFLEVTRPDGQGVQWEAGYTNTLGTAHVALVALQNPGPLTLHLYADKSGRSAVLSEPFRVKLR